MDDDGHDYEPLFPDVKDSNGISWTDPFYDPWAD